MAKLTKDAVHIDAALTNFAVSYMQDSNLFVADKVFPVVPVAKQSGKHFNWSKADLLRDKAIKRAPGTLSAGGDVSLSTPGTFDCSEDGYHQDLADEIRATMDEPLNGDRDTTEQVMQTLLIRREIAFADAYFKTGKWAAEWVGKAAAPGANEFLQFDVATSDPMKIIEDAKDIVQEQTGFRPNVMTVSQKVHTALRNNPVLRGLMNYSQDRILTQAKLAQFFEVDKYLVAGGIYNSAIEGKAAVIASILGKNVLLSYAPPLPSFTKPSAGYIFTYNYNAQYKDGIAMYRYRLDTGERADRFDGSLFCDMKQVCADAAIFLLNAIA